MRISIDLYGNFQASKVVARAELPAKTIIFLPKSPRSVKQAAL